MSDKIIPFRPRKAPSLMEQRGEQRAEQPPSDAAAGPNEAGDGDWTLVKVVAQTPPPTR